MAAAAASTSSCDDLWLCDRDSFGASNLTPAAGRGSDLVATPTRLYLVLVFILLFFGLLGRVCPLSIQYRQSSMSCRVSCASRMRIRYSYSVDRFESCSWMSRRPV